MSNVDKDEHLIAHFHSFLLTEKRVSQNTFFAYKKDVDQMLVFFKKNKVSIKSCTKNNLKKFLKQLKMNNLSAKTLSRKISSLKALFNFLSEKFEIKNHAKAFIFPKIEKTLPKYLTEKEIEELLVASNKDQSIKGLRNKVMLYLLYASGMRVSELVNLKIEQLHFDTGFVCLVGKGNKERLVPLPTEIFKLLSFYLDNIYEKLKPKSNQKSPAENFLFFSYIKGKMRPITRQSFWIILKKILLLANIKKNVSPHTLRHSLATHLLKSGTNIRSLQLLLGHEQLSTIQIYTHLEKSHIRKVYDEKHPRA